MKTHEILSILNTYLLIYKTISITFAALKEKKWQITKAQLRESVATKRRDYAIDTSTRQLVLGLRKYVLLRRKTKLKNC